MNIKEEIQYVRDTIARLEMLSDKNDEFGSVEYHMVENSRIILNTLEKMTSSQTISESEA